MFRHKTILIVEHSDSMRLLLQTFLSKEGYATAIALDGQQAIEKALTEQPDLILLDFVLADMNGPEVCKRLRERKETQSTPIVMVTTRTAPEKVQAAFESGCNEYVTKPINNAELLSKIKHYLE